MDQVPRFILDVHLGKLAKYLRLFGFDAHLDMNLDDRQIIDSAFKQNRIILTRDKLLLENSRVTHGYFVRSQDPHMQADEVCERFVLASKMNPFSRCLECNVLVEDVSKDEVIDRIPEKTRLFYDKFRICPNCRRIFWEGSHYERMKEFVKQFEK